MITTLFKNMSQNIEYLFCGIKKKVYFAKKMYKVREMDKTEVDLSQEKIDFINDA